MTTVRLVRLKLDSGWQVADGATAPTAMVKVDRLRTKAGEKLEVAELFLAGKVFLPVKDVSEADVHRQTELATVPEAFRPTEKVQLLETTREKLFEDLPRTATGAVPSITEPYVSLRLYPDGRLVIGAPTAEDISLDGVRAVIRFPVVPEGEELVS